MTCDTRGVVVTTQLSIITIIRSIMCKFCSSSFKSPLENGDGRIFSLGTSTKSSSQFKICKIEISIQFQAGNVMSWTVAAVLLFRSLRPCALDQNCVCPFCKLSVFNNFARTADKQCVRISENSYSIVGFYVIDMRKAPKHTFSEHRSSKNVMLRK